jgi:phenylalanine-4-hydroxylase
VPMHAHPVFADFLQHYGKVCAALTNPNDLERMGRIFWFTVEFGVIRQDGEIKVYGSGLISSHGECSRIVGEDSSERPEIRRFNLDEVMDQEFSTSEMQRVLYAVKSFDEIYEATHEAEKRLGLNLD